MSTVTDSQPSLSQYSRTPELTHEERKHDLTDKKNNSILPVFGNKTILIVAHTMT